MYLDDALESGINEWGDEFGVQCDVCETLFQPYQLDEGCPCCGSPAIEWRDVVFNPYSAVLVDVFEKESDRLPLP